MKHILTGLMATALLSSSCFAQAPAAPAPAAAAPAAAAPAAPRPAGRPLAPYATLAGNDIDKDGTVTRLEYLQTNLKRFAMMDVNRDNVLTYDERNLARTRRAAGDTR